MLPLTMLRISPLCFCRCTTASALQKQFLHVSAVRSKMVPLKSIPANELGKSIMHLQENGSSRSSTDELKRMIKFAKVISLSSSSLGIVMIPVLTSKLMEAAADNPGAMVLLVFANSFIGLLTFTPLLLHFLTKRFVANVYYNSESQLFTSVHYNFLMQKQALRFRSDDVVDLTVALQKKKMLFPMATCFVDSHPLLLLLDRRLYSNQDAFALLTKNVNIPEGHE